MSSVIGLILAALILVFFEVILPGGILGLIATLCVFIAIWIAGSQYGVGVATLTFFCAFAAIGALIYVEFKLLARTSLGSNFFLKAKVSGKLNKAPSAVDIIGKEGIALTRLNPSGKVEIDGQIYQAYSIDGYIDPNQRIRVNSQDNFKIIIKKI